VKRKARCVMKCSQVSKRERGAQQAVADLMSHPHAVEVLCAELDARAADHERNAAYARRNAVRSEAAGDAEGAAGWADIAESHSAWGAQLAAQRKEIIERFGRRLPPFDGGC
jgi:hypothetical protein